MLKPDQYNLAGGTMSIGNDGWHVLKDVGNGKNASSSNYYRQFTKYWFTPSSD